MSLFNYKLLVKRSNSYFFPSVSVIFLSAWLYFLNSMEREFAGLSFLLLMGLQGLMYLSTIWSVKIKAWYSCRHASGINEGTHVLVVPGPHQGSAELVLLNKSKEGIFFVFQKKKYIWDKDTKDFKGIDYPGDTPTKFMEFKEMDGLKGESELRRASGKYGYNRYFRNS